MTNKKSTAQGKYYIGLMSGTSADGIDLALVDFKDPKQQTRLVASYYQDYNSAISEKITSLYQPGSNEIDRAFHLDVELAQLFAQAITALLKQENLSASDIIAIGNHGQTIRHRPTGANPFTLQIGCCQTLATLTGIRVVGQFRRKDMALGGQGAPLVPIFHQQLFAESNEANFVVNIGGIANITFLPAQNAKSSILGFDTGPGNALLDDWFLKHHASSDDKFDRDGAWATTGQVNQTLLTQMLADDYIKAAAPKSTGRECFNLAWLAQQLSSFKEKSNSPACSAVPNAVPNAVDIQATLLAFTAQSISTAIMALAKQAKVYLCGGGVHNSALVAALTDNLNRSGSVYKVDTMQALNIDGDILEAMAFAWLAYAFDHNLISNMPAVTGASASCTLGSEFLP
ncbi:anhydro-N-acetylmuramic acid kinase [Colwellia sp. MT41]|uniref:anhydro-N-acetylmuramic acid kinase n=1 Tax=Colwellia sp. MT41 TaxID=58049 RepID=UPI0007178C15|nr:anhydro-N-acetylmuramic acid kinase [Colwellia sp. MT41]ALO36198.1 anhydro-N-acetylmuramic acid kinase [Colwellia sp. MT41]